MMSAAVSRRDSTLNVDKPRALFRTRLRPMGRLDAYAYDVHPDGQRFLLSTFVEEVASTELTLVVNWPSSVK